MDGLACDRADWPRAPAALDNAMSLPGPAAICGPGTADQRFPPEHVKWAGIDAETHGAWVQAADGGRFRLLVERLPEGGWDWAIWHTDDRARGDCGKALTAICAMLAAEHALLRIAGETR